MTGFWTMLYQAREELLLFSGFWFLVGGLDDLLIDLIWGVRAGWRRLTRYRDTPPLRADQLPVPSSRGLIAVMIPAWQEAAVIGRMLRHCRESWSSSGVDYRLYVGCYPNDPASIATIMAAGKGDACVRLVLCDNPGPTTKADCLNRLWRAVTSDELEGGYKVKALVLHDAEDAVHPMELRLFDYLIERAAAVQLPVIPVQVPGSAWVSGHYCDEFAEAHGKTLVVREALGAAVPLAGVGCAIERNWLGRLAISRGGDPFDADSLVEDYELGLNLGADSGKVIFARLLDGEDQLVGTRACFPETFDAATRQKARWMTGIALAGWDRLGWRGGIAEKWMRLRDRKAVFAALVLTSAYICIALTALLIGVERAGLAVPPPLPPAIKAVLLLTFILLVWRTAVRAFFVWRMHGMRQACLSLPRGLVANIIAIIAARRACWAYVRHILGGTLGWDKTSHAHFPEASPQHG